MMKAEKIIREAFDPRLSIQRAAGAKKIVPAWKIISEGKTYTWSSNLERVDLIRKGLPYSTIEVISQKIDLPVKDVLELFSLPQTTYNKKKREQSLLPSRDSETILLLTEMLTFGTEVFNNEEVKFRRWLKKPNIALGDNTPESLLDSTTGIQEIYNCLNRLEYGNFA